MTNLDKRDELAQTIAEITDAIERPGWAPMLWYLCKKRGELRKQLADLEAPTLYSLGLGEWEIKS